MELYTDVPQHKFFTPQIKDKSTKSINNTNKFKLPSPIIFRRDMSTFVLRSTFEIMF